MENYKPLSNNTSALPGKPIKDVVAYENSTLGNEPYALGPESLEQTEVPKGTLLSFQMESKIIYPGTNRDFKLYLPYQYEFGTQLNLVTFLDGISNYLEPSTNAHVVLDNLIFYGKIHPTAAVFLDAGDNGPGLPIYGGGFQGSFSNRSFEYDCTDDRFVRFLVEEILPEVQKYCSFSTNPRNNVICGFSSSGHAAFSAAWHRPDLFGNVISHCGSFTNIRGGHNYPSIIRKTPRKPIRVFLQTGRNDLNTIFGNWTIANQDMASALDYREYDYQFVLGEGGHTLKHGSYILPETIQWAFQNSKSR